MIRLDGSDCRVMVVVKLSLWEGGSTAHVSWPTRGMQNVVDAGIEAAAPLLMVAEQRARLMTGLVWLEVGSCVSRTTRKSR